MRHSFQVRREFYELVCLRGWGLSPAVHAVGAGEGSATRWWRQAFGMDMAVSMGKFGGSRIGVARDVEPHRQGSRRPLSLADRAMIEYGLDHGHAHAHIAARIGRCRSVVSRELARNSCSDGMYSSAAAHLRATAGRARPKPFKLDDPVLAGRVSDLLELGWSPELIAHHLASGGSGDDESVSHETIYQALYVQGRGRLRADLHEHLSTRRTRRQSQSRAARAASSGPSPFKEAFTISQRPAEADDRAVPGHWEGDLIVGPYSRSAIGTLVERSTRFVILLHLPSRHTAIEVADAMITAMGDLPEHLRRSLTWDRGTEMADYARIQTALDMKVYFCDPHSPWQRGSNENTNRLLRHWFPKGSDLSGHSIDDLQAAQDALNSRPRPTLDYETPATRLNRLLAQAA